jgi:hypothetical protein
MQAWEVLMMQMPEAPTTQAQEKPMTQVSEALTTHAQDGSDISLLQGGACSGRTVTTDALLSVNNIDTDGIEPRPDDTIGGPCLDLMVRSSIPSMPGGTTPGDAVSVPGFLGVVDPGVTGLGSPGYADSLSPPVN